MRGQEDDRFNPYSNDYIGSNSSHKNNPANSTNTEAIQRAEEAAANTNNTNTQNSSTGPVGNKIKEYFKKFKSGTKGPIAAALVLLTGGFLGFYSLMAPSIGLSQMIETLTGDLNSSVAGMNKTHRQLMRAKLKKTTAGNCGIVKIACRFKTVNVEKTKAAFKLQGFDVNFDMDKGFGKNRGKITDMTWTNPMDKKEVIKINSAAELESMLRKNPQFRAHYNNALSPKFLTLKNKVAMKFLSKMKTNYARKITGKNTKEFDESMKKATGSKVNLGSKNIRPEKDKNGKETGNFVDEDGKVYTPEEAKALKETETKIKSSPSSSSVTKNLAKGLEITGAIDTACSVYNTSRAVAFAAKVARKAALIRYFMVFANTYSVMQAGESTPEQIDYISRKISATDEREKVVDESKLKDTPAGQKLPMHDNPNYKKAGLDAAFYKQSAFQDIPKKDIGSQRFMVGGGLTGTLDSVNQQIAKVLGSDSPKELTKRCGIVQNPVVRGGSLVVGVLVGIGTFGIGTAVSIAASAAVSFAMPYLVAQLGDIIAGRVVGPELEGVDAVNAASVGASGMFNGVARAQGMIPMTPEKMVEYQNTNRKDQVAYEEDERLIASVNHLNVLDKFSFMGKLGRSFLPIHNTIKTDGTKLIATLPTLFSQAINSINPKANAIFSSQIRIERYKQCNDETYKEMNVAVDSSCSILFGLPKEAMEADPIEIAEWMAANGEIDPESETGEVKDNRQKWNYKKFLDNCINQEPGAHEDPEESPDNGYSCVSPENYEKNWRYAKYTVSKNWNETLDGEVPGIEKTGNSNFDSGEKGEVSTDGWAWPSTNDAVITSPFGIRGGAPHNGIDIAQPGSALNKPIFAARDGKVIAAGAADGFGNWIVIQHEINGKRYDTVYGHMFNDGVIAKQGDQVKAGQEIGKIGNNGQSSGPHLHFEIWEGGHRNFSGGKAIDPANIVKPGNNRGGS